MSYMKEKMIKVLNEKMDLYFDIVGITQSKGDIIKKADDILKKCKDFEEGD